MASVADAASKETVATLESTKQAAGPSVKAKAGQPAVKAKSSTPREKAAASKAPGASAKRAGTPGASAKRTAEASTAKRTATTAVAKQTASPGTAKRPASPGSGSAASPNQTPSPGAPTKAAPSTAPKQVARPKSPAKQGGAPAVAPKPAASPPPASAKASAASPKRPPSPKTAVAKRPPASPKDAAKAGSKASVPSKAQALTPRTAAAKGAIRKAQPPTPRTAAAQLKVQNLQKASAEPKSVIRKGTASAEMREGKPSTPADSEATGIAANAVSDEALLTTAVEVELESSSVSLPAANEVVRIFQSASVVVAEQTDSQTGEDTTSPRESSVQRRSGSSSPRSSAQRRSGSGSPTRRSKPTLSAPTDGIPSTEEDSSKRISETRNGPVVQPQDLSVPSSVPSRSSPDSNSEGQSKFVSKGWIPPRIAPPRESESNEEPKNAVRTFGSSKNEAVAVSKDLAGGASKDVVVEEPASSMSTSPVAAEELALRPTTSTAAVGSNVEVPKQRSSQRANSSSRTSSANRRITDSAAVGSNAEVPKQRSSQTANSSTRTSSANRRTSDPVKASPKGASVVSPALEILGPARNAPHLRQSQVAKQVNLVSEDILDEPSASAKDESLDANNDDDMARKRAQRYLQLQRNKGSAVMKQPERNSQRQSQRSSNNNSASGTDEPSAVEAVAASEEVTSAVIEAEDIALEPRVSSQSTGLTQRLFIDQSNEENAEASCTEDESAEQVDTEETPQEGNAAEEEGQASQQLQEPAVKPVGHAIVANYVCNGNDKEQDTRREVETLREAVAEMRNQLQQARQQTSQLERQCERYQSQVAEILQGDMRDMEVLRPASRSPPPRICSPRSDPVFMNGPRSASPCYFGTPTYPTLAPSHMGTPGNPLPPMFMSAPPAPLNRVEALTPGRAATAQGRHRLEERSPSPMRSLSQPRTTCDGRGFVLASPRMVTMPAMPSQIAFAAAAPQGTLRPALSLGAAGTWTSGPGATLTSPGSFAGATWGAPAWTMQTTPRAPS
eukprot:gnl/MRDRNA2_/MRDRNA2_72660_c0_seq1.p1 gnl/MRDRNA2_/MRDRNA2_72660_c0~~gnl/MRDRNA2_/MRDRNA2_72660_c0_seq1.p1  ORF type:complete len:1017 (+),score=256.30 gnl/MRDRNA2_/MRDRNA2_72660_c0_seq1:96-3146(+)